MNLRYSKKFAVPFLLPIVQMIFMEFSNYEYLPPCVQLPENQRRDHHGQPGPVGEQEDHGEVDGQVGKERPGDFGEGDVADAAADQRSQADRGRKRPMPMLAINTMPK